MNRKKKCVSHMIVKFGRKNGDYSFNSKLICNEYSVM